MLKVLVKAEGDKTVLGHFQKNWTVWVSPFRSKRFMLDWMTQQNASKFAIFGEYEKGHIIMLDEMTHRNTFKNFHFVLYSIFYQINALIYVDID